MLLPQDGSGKVPTTAPYTFVNQLNTARRFMWNKATKVRRTVDAASHFSLEVLVMVVSVGIDVSKDTAIMTTPCHGNISVYWKNTLHGATEIKVLLVLSVSSGQRCGNFSVFWMGVE